MPLPWAVGEAEVPLAEGVPVPVSELTWELRPAATEEA